MLEEMWKVRTGVEVQAEYEIADQAAIVGEPRSRADDAQSCFAKLTAWAVAWRERQQQLNSALIASL